MNTTFTVVSDEAANILNSQNLTSLQSNLSPQELLEMQYQLSLSTISTPSIQLSSIYTQATQNMRSVEDRLAEMIATQAQQDRAAAIGTYITSTSAAAAAPLSLTQTAADPLLSLHPVARPPASSPF